MATEMQAFVFDSNKRPQYLTNFNSGIGTNLAVGGFLGNRIGLRNSKFRLVVAGQEELVLKEDYLDVVIIGASPGVSRMWYSGKYQVGSKEAPKCFSIDGIKPESSSREVQSTTCALCKQNEKGSAANGEGRACSFFKRLAVTTMDLQRVFKLECKSKSIFGEGDPAHNLFKLGEYGRKLSTRGIDVAHLVTRLSFDPNASVPELMFTPLRYLEPDEASRVQDLITSDETKQVLEITVASIDLSGETSIEDAAPAEAEPEQSPTAPPAAAPVAATSVAKPVPASPVAKPAARAPIVVQTAKANVVAVASKAVVKAEPVEEASDDENADLDALLKQLEG